MNQQFAHYSTSTAFSISLSKWAIDELFQLEAYTSDSYYGLPMYHKGTESYLQRRGLIQRSPEHGCEMNWILSEAGRLMCSLLKEAGFENRYKEAPCSASSQSS